MSNLLERSILLTVGAAAIALDMTETLATELLKRGEDATDEGRKAVDELMVRARDEARTVKESLDSSLHRTITEMALPSKEKMEEIELKLAQLEHRLSLLENGKAKGGVEPDAGEAPVKEADQ